MQDGNDANTASAQTHPSPFPENELRDYVVSHIDEAIERGWVRPYYQPVIRTLTGKLCGFEALARWEDPAHGTLAPIAFIEPLEEARLIHKLDCCIVERVCRQIREDADAGETVVPVSFNLSRLDFDLCDMFGVVEKAVHRYGIPRSMLNIEITESSLAADPAYMTSVMGAFHDAGYQVWMDDFGSGYSTLNTLKDFEFDELKIDMEFLNRFGGKSKTILASVVDMAKKLGIETLAEGVETEEHRRFLKRIGCEKMQGYLFGRPYPHSSGELSDVRAACGVETGSERAYISEVGAVNTLSMSERDLTADASTRDYVTSMPLAIVEYEGDRFKIVDSNRVFREGLANVGIDSIEEAERRVNDTRFTIARQARRFVDTIAEDKYARIDYVVGDTACVMRAKHITTRGGKTAVLCSIDDTIEQKKHRRHDRMTDVLAVIYSIYEHVDIIHVDEGFIEPVFDNAGYHFHLGVSSLDHAVGRFAKHDVFFSDVGRFRAFMDLSSMVERIRESGENYIVDFFRIRQQGGEFTWKLFGLIALDERFGGQVLLCIRSTHWANDGLLQAAFSDHTDAGAIDPTNLDLTMSDSSLWKALLTDRRMGLFWKDRNRRFLGVNQAFLDYYGFESADEVIGKTDEDMGWHIDPIPFMQDELAVLNEGARIEGEFGHCIARGEVRDIIATKRPVYRGGHIVGLVGYFVDAAEQEQGARETESLPVRDKITGVLNYTGLEAATWRYVDTYKREGVDFAMISVNVEDFKEINDGYGIEFGEKVLKRVADELREAVGQRCVVGHVYAERFVVLVQDESDEVLQGLCDAIERKLNAIARVDGTPCTVYALAGFSRFSQIGDVDAMKKRNQERRNARRDARDGRASGDVITSNLL